MYVSAHALLRANTTRFWHNRLLLPVGISTPQAPQCLSKFFSNCSLIQCHSGKEDSADSLIVNCTYPQYDISVHKGYRIQAALCIDRLPLIYEEPRAHRKWREFVKRWHEEAGGSLELPDAITYMKLPCQFLETDEEKKRKTMLLSKSGVANVDTLELMLNPAVGQQTDIMRDSINRVTEKQNMSQDKHISSLSVTDTKLQYTSGKSFGGREVERDVGDEEERMDTRSLRRKPRETLYLIVKYKDNFSDQDRQSTFWTFPFSDRIHGDSMRETLLRICHEHFGDVYEPFLVGHCPFTFYKKKYSEAIRKAGLRGRKVFFYRAHHIPGHDNVVLPQLDTVQYSTKSRGLVPVDVAWVTSDELSQYLTEKLLSTVRDGLYLM
eukprot:GHVQ01017577.1.p1 GENE.GHVQ01017577.1~~GHVQ01017577.1.p1  ORF type:complete len:380 (-),score=38.91 GHVQ01017577.1:1167-2306(-)